MVFKPPREEWDQVTRIVSDPAGPTLRFSVTDDGMWREELIVLSPNPPEPETGQLEDWELLVLDAIVDQINREPIPDQARCRPPVSHDVGFSLDLTNDATTSRLLSNDRGGNCILADDRLDRLEIAALDAFMSYLDNKYGEFSADTIIG
jgi:hypothetical protein